jgi:hypothetical protein
MTFADIFSRRKATQELRATGIEFLGEQDGANERSLKEKLSVLFREQESVKAAYLVRAQYAKPEMKSVVLCVVAIGGPDKSLVESVHSLFRKEAPRGIILDIMFPTDKERSQIDAVCKPFYSSDSEM